MDATKPKIITTDTLLQSHSKGVSGELVGGSAL